MSTSQTQTVSLETLTPADDGTRQSSGSTTPTRTSGEPAAPPVNEKHVFNDQTRYVPKRTVIMVFLATASISLVTLIDQTTLAVALSTIGASLGAGPQTSWIASSYFLTSTSFQLLYGRLSDIWSRKNVLLVGVALFFIGSLGSSLAQNAPTLIAFRAIVGIGGGGIATVAQIIVSDVVTLRERGKYQGILGAVVAISNGIGPVIGGALASKSKESWRWIFRLNLPLCAFSTVCIVFFMPLRKVEGSWKRKLAAVDFPGAALVLASTTLMILGLTWAGGAYSWGSSHVLATLLVGLGVLATFVLWEWKGHPLPLIPLHVFRQRMTDGACLTMFINGWNFVVQVYYIPLFYQLAYQYSPVKAGALLLPVTVVQTLASTLSGLLVNWIGRYRELLLFGWALWAVGLGCMSTLNGTEGIGRAIGFSILIGLGVGATLQPSLIAIQSGVARRDMAVITATRNFIRNLGATLGLAIAGTVINDYARRALDPLSNTIPADALLDLLSAPTETLSDLGLTTAQQADVHAALLRGYAQGFRVVFLLGAGLAALGFVFAFFLMPQLDLDRKDDAELRRVGKEEDEKRRGKNVGAAGRTLGEEGIKGDAQDVKGERAAVKEVLGRESTNS